MKRVRACFAVLAVSILAGVLAGGQAAASPELLIRGGEEVGRGELPSLAFVAYIGEEGAISCTGTVIAPRLVLTAAHCAEHAILPGGPEGFRVVTGNVDWTAPERQVIGVEREIVHPSFNEWKGRNDIAMLVLNAPTVAPPIPVAGKAIWHPGTPAVIVGWGNLTPRQPLVTRVLHRANTFVRDGSWCHKRAPQVVTGGHHICVADAPIYRSSTCDGDSGGPLLMHRPSDGALIEIGVLRGGYCVPNRPTWFTPTDSVIHWIHRVMAQVAAS